MRIVNIRASRDGLMHGFQSDASTVRSRCGAPRILRLMRVRPPWEVPTYCRKDMDYDKVAETVAEAIRKSSTPLTKEQKFALTRSLSIWLEKARMEGFDHANNMQAHCARNGINWP